MLSNDLSKKLMLRFKKSKDFNKTIDKLKQEGYTTRLRKKKYKRCLRVSLAGCLVFLIEYEDIEDFKDSEEYELWKDSEYKQRIIYMFY